ACFSCGWRKYGFGAAWRSMRSTFCAIAWLMPWTHCDGCPWVGNSVNLIPNRFATFCIAWSIVSTKGIALEIGMLKIDLPAAFLASNAGPGGMNFGIAFAFVIWALTYARSAAVACVLTALVRAVEPARLAAANDAATTPATNATNAHRSRE